VTTFEEVLRHNFQTNRPTLDGLLSDERWLSGPFVSRDWFKKIVQKLDNGKERPITSLDCLKALDVAQLELWFRYLQRHELFEIPCGW
jgi:hypothetical protein